MTSKRAVISGASIAGLSTAWWLQRTGWRVTVIERAAGFRDGGQNVDVRGVAHDVLDDAGGLTLTTEAGRRLRPDLLVVAEGVGSTTRAQLFGDLVDAVDLDITMVFGTIGRTPADDDRWRWYDAVGGRQVHLRPDCHGTTRRLRACSTASTSPTTCTSTA